MHERRLFVAVYERTGQSTKSHLVGASADPEICAEVGRLIAERTDPNRGLAEGFPQVPSTEPRKA